MQQNKEVLQGHEARLKIKAGIDKAFKAVAPTIGPVGMTAIIEFLGLDPIECDDGVTILKNINLKDHYENMGVQILRKAGLRTSQEGGDGTATTTVLTHALITEAFKEIANDSSKIREVKESLQAGLKEVITELSKIKREVKEEDIERIATISSLDPEVAKLIAEVIKDVGVNGVITVEKGSKLGYSKEVVKGAKIDKGLVSPFFINNHNTQSTVLNNPYIVLVDRKLSTNEQIMPILNSIGTGNDILFIADDIDSVALGTLAQNAVNKLANIACVRNPYTASRARDFLFDIASLTGATVISEEMGMKLSEADKKLCGRAEKVVVTRDSTMIINGNSNSLLEERVKAIQAEIDTTVSEYSKLILEERLAQLTSGIGVIRVGAYTDTEFNAKKYKFDNAINATQSALQEGIVIGGGSALAHVSNSITNKMFRKALQAPFKQMAENAGVTDVVESLHFDTDEGFNFINKEKVNMFDEGIIDPFKVVRLALESATAITSSLICVETAIVNIDEVKEKNG